MLTFLKHMVLYLLFCICGTPCSFLCNSFRLVTVFLAKWHNKRKKNLCFSPTTNAIMGLTVANYILQPFFPGDCGVPTLAAQLMAAALICNVKIIKM